MNFEKGASYIRDLRNCSQKHIKLLTASRESMIMKTLCTNREGIKIPFRKKKNLFTNTKQGEINLFAAFRGDFLSFFFHLHCESDEKDLKHLHFETIK